MTGNDRERPKWGEEAAEGDATSVDVPEATVFPRSEALEVTRQHHSPTRAPLDPDAKPDWWSLSHSGQTDPEVRAKVVDAIKQRHAKKSAPPPPVLEGEETLLDEDAAPIAHAIAPPTAASATPPTVGASAAPPAVAVAPARAVGVPSGPTPPPSFSSRPPPASTPHATWTPSVPPSAPTARTPPKGPLPTTTRSDLHLTIGLAILVGVIVLLGLAVLVGIVGHLF